MTGGVGGVMTNNWPFRGQKRFPHDKFRNFGIEIYACVDVYLRRIQ